MNSLNHLLNIPLPFKLKRNIQVNMIEMDNQKRKDQKYYILIGETVLLEQIEKDKHKKNNGNSLNEIQIQICYFFEEMKVSINSRVIYD